jgi:hypothetical protein
MRMRRLMMTLSMSSYHHLTDYEDNKDEEYVDVEDEDEEEEHVEEDDDDGVEDDVIEVKASSTAVASRVSSKQKYHVVDSFLAMVQSASSKCRKLSSTAAASSVTGE